MNSLFFINTSLICLSLKYLRKNYNLVSKVSKWIYFELAKVNYRESKFIRSLYERDFEVIKVLINFNKNIELLSKYLIQYYSYTKNYFDIIKLFIDNGANIHANDDQILRYASFDGRYDIVKLLIDNGGDIHAQDDYPLKYATNNGHIEIVKLLIDNGGDIHIQNNLLIGIAKYKGYYDIVKLFENEDEIKIKKW